jgi:hypothetical protein
MCFLSRYVHRICLRNVFCNCFATSSFFLLIAFRDAVNGSFPGVTHLMCYFHVVKNCKEKLRSYAKDVQQDILHDVQQLHSSVSAQECNALMTRFIPKWTKVVPDFMTYFLHQWMVSDFFGSWKVYYLTKRLPSREVQLAMKKIDQSTYRVSTLLITVRNDV